MSFDLAISDHGDLIVTGHHDLAGKSGTDLIEQRMMIRLKLMRGSWIYDDDKTLGSDLHNLTGVPLDKAAATIPAYAREALRAIDDISIQDIQVTISGHNAILVVFYRVSDVNADTAPQQFQMMLPVAGGGV